MITDATMWLFDADWYRAKYGHLLNGEEPLKHFNRAGAGLEHDPHPYFNAKWYLDNHPTAAASGLTPVAHYLSVGAKTGLSPHPLFDSRYYLQHALAGQPVGSDPLHHFITVGEESGAKPHLFFDTAYYRRQHPDDAEAEARPLRHYLANGQDKGNDPNPFFDNQWYASKHDLKSLSALEHYLQFGEYQGASPHPLWDEQLNCSINVARGRMVQNGVLRSGYRKLVEHGSAHTSEATATFAFREADHLYYYDPYAYLSSQPEAKSAVVTGKNASGLSYLFNGGLDQWKSSARPFYDASHRVSLVRDIQGSAKSRGKYLCLFAHFDPKNVVDPYVVKYLKCLNRMGCDTVVITPTDTQSELEKILPHVSRVLVKRNKDHDFGSWWLALSLLGQDCGKSYKRLIFANDSIYFPVRPAEPFFAGLERSEANIYGLCDSYEIEHHVQSYFLCFDRAAQDAIIPWFMDRFSRNHALPKSEIVNQYEVGISKKARECGLTLATYFDMHKALALVVDNPKFAEWQELLNFRFGLMNPSLLLWDMMLEHFDYPALKVSFLKIGAATRTRRLPDLNKFVADGEVTFVDIAQHQVRVTPKPSPDPAGKP